MMWMKSKQFKRIDYLRYDVINYLCKYYGHFLLLLMLKEIYWWNKFAPVKVLCRGLLGCCELPRLSAIYIVSVVFVPTLTATTELSVKQHGKNWSTYLDIWKEKRLIFPFGPNTSCQPLISGNWKSKSPIPNNLVVFCCELTYAWTIFSRRLMGSTDQADPSCFYFRISWILMERLWFYFFYFHK